MQRLLNDAAEDPDQLPILQHALMRTWEAWIKDRGADEPIDLRHYEAIGAVKEALSRHADEIYDALPDDRHRRVAEKTFKALAETGRDARGTRRPARFAELQAITESAASESGAVIEAFRQPGRTFLMPGTDVALTGDTIIDISHESLMRIWRRMRSWVEEEAASARTYRRLAETASLWKEGTAGLYRDPDLQIAVRWREKAQPTAAWAERYHAGFAQAIEFLEKSQQEDQSEKQAKAAPRAVNSSRPGLWPRRSESWRKRKPARLGACAGFPAPWLSWLC